MVNIQRIGFSLCLPLFLSTIALASIGVSLKTLVDSLNNEKAVEYLKSVGLYEKVVRYIDYVKAHQDYFKHDGDMMSHKGKGILFADSI